MHTWHQALLYATTHVWQAEKARKVGEKRKAEAAAAEAAGVEPKKKKQKRLKPKASAGPRYRPSLETHHRRRHVRWDGYRRASTLSTCRDESFPTVHGMCPYASLYTHLYTCLHTGGAAVIDLDDWTPESTSSRGARTSWINGVPYRQCGLTVHMWIKGTPYRHVD